MNFGNAIKTLRMLRKMKQEIAAQRACMDERTLRNQESNKTRMSAELVAVFAEIYDVSVACQIVVVNIPALA